MSTEITQYGSLQEHAAALIISEQADIDRDLLLSRLKNILTKTPKLASMPAQAIANATLTAMAPDPSLSNWEDIYMVPYGQTINVSFSHNFLQKLALKNGAVRVFNVHLIHDSDNVSITENGMTFSVDPFGANRTMENFKGVLVEAILANGEKKYGITPRDHIEKARGASKASGSGPWKTWYYEMAKKVAIKNLLKGLEISREYAEAIRIDNVEYDFSKKTMPPETKSEVNALEALNSTIQSTAKREFISNSTLAEAGYDFIEHEGWVMFEEKDLSDSFIEEHQLLSKPSKPGKLFGRLEKPSNVIEAPKGAQ